MENPPRSPVEKISGKLNETSQCTYGQLVPDTIEHKIHKFSTGNTGSGTRCAKLHISFFKLWNSLGNNVGSCYKPNIILLIITASQPCCRGLNVASMGWCHDMSANRPQTWAISWVCRGTEIVLKCTEIATYIACGKNEKISVSRKKWLKRFFCAAAMAWQPNCNYGNGSVSEWSM